MRPIDSTKNIVQSSGIIVANTNTLITPIIVETVDSAAIAVQNEVERGCKISWIYLSLFFYSESGGGVAQVPLTDWYVMKDEQSVMSLAGFGANGLPTPGATGTHKNKYAILHEETGLAGQQAAGSPPMVFQGVIRIPRGKQSFSSQDRFILCARTNFDTKYCLKAIYKWFK